jgi:hypothetical protein
MFHEHGIRRTRSKMISFMVENFLFFLPFLFLTGSTHHSKLGLGGRVGTGRWARFGFRGGGVRRVFSNL